MQQSRSKNSLRPISNFAPCRWYVDGRAASQVFTGNECRPGGRRRLCAEGAAAPRRTSGAQSRVVSPCCVFTEVTQK